jgi:hypothetical protein
MTNTQNWIQVSIVTPEQGPLWSWSHGSSIYNCLCNQCLSPKKLWVRAPFDTNLCDKVCQWLAASLWFSPGTPFPPSIKTDRHDITEILLKISLNTINQPYPTDSCFLARLYNKTSVNIVFSGQYDTTFTT